MIKIYLKTNNNLLFKSIKSIFDKIGTYELTSTPQNYNIIEERKDTFIINNKIIIKKPLYIKELLKKNIFANSFSFSNFQVNKETREISYDKKSSLLTQTELKILELLYENTEGISTDDILKNVLKYSTNSTSSSPTTHLYNLRKKLSHLNDKDNIILKDEKYKLL
jgi:hypothetical protein